MRSIDRDARAAVFGLNRVPGVTTTESCQGGSRGSGHSAFAYVRFRHPLPPRFRSYLLARVGGIARVEDTAAYARRPEWNQLFLRALAEAASAYRRRYARLPISRFRIRARTLRRRLARASPSGIALCLHCGRTRPCGNAEHLQLRLAPIDEAMRDGWFRDFTEVPENQLPADLRASESPARLRARAENGQFGEAYLRRWAAFEKRAAGAAVEAQVLRAVRLARTDARWRDLEVYRHRGVLVFEWPLRRPRARRHLGTCAGRAKP